MCAVSFVKAVKTKAKLRLALCGLAGTGKTYSALSIASSMARLIRDSGNGEGRIAVIDSERGSASLYADKFEFDVAELDAFSPLAYVEKIKEAEQAGYDIIIVDSLTHAWSGKDGALDQKDQAADRGGNSWTAWRSVTPKHNALVDSLVGSKSHVIATMRTKMEYVQERDEKSGKTEIKKVGLAVIQREGMEYEFTLVGDLDLTHALKISKTRCDGYISLGDLFEKPGENFARRVYGWLQNGAEAKPPAVVTQRAANDAQSTPTAAAPSAVDVAVDEAFAVYLARLNAATTLPELDAAATGSGRPAKGSAQYQQATQAYLSCKAALEVKAKEQAA